MANTARADFARLVGPRRFVGVANQGTLCRVTRNASRIYTKRELQLARNAPPIFVRRSHQGASTSTTSCWENEARRAAEASSSTEPAMRLGLRTKPKQRKNNQADCRVWKSRLNMSRLERRNFPTRLQGARNKPSGWSVRPSCLGALLATRPLASTKSSAKATSRKFMKPYPRSSRRSLVTTRRCAFDRDTCGANLVIKA